MDDVGGHGSYKRIQWESSFKEGLETLIGLHKSRIQILDCRAASVLVEVLLLPPPSVNNVEQTMRTDPTLLLPAEIASERLRTAVAAAANYETPPPSLGGMQVMLQIERVAPPAPPFNPLAQQISSALSVESSVSVLTNRVEDTDTQTIAMAGFAFLAPVILAVCLVWRLWRQRRLAERREDKEYRKSTIQLDLDELPELPDAPSLPIPPPPLGTGHSIPAPPPRPDGDDSLSPPPLHLDEGLRALPMPQHSQKALPGPAVLPAPGSAFEDDLVPHAKPTLSRPAKGSPTKGRSLVNLYAADEDVSYHPALARLAKKAVAKQELLMREEVDDHSRLRKIVKQGTPIRVIQQRKGDDGEKRALITFDPPTADRKGRVAGWVMLSMIELLEQKDSSTHSPPTTTRTVIGANEFSERTLDADDKPLIKADPASPRPPRSISRATIGIVGEGFAPEDGEQAYITRITLKMRADADMKSDPAGEMPANAHVHVREWCTLPEGTRRALVCEVNSSPEKSGWLSCATRDGAETLVPTTARVDEEHIFLALPRKQAAGSGPSTQRSSSSATSINAAPLPAPAAPMPMPAPTATPLTPETTTEGVPGVSKYQLIMRERMENSSRLRKVIKKGIAVRVLRQGIASDGGKRALVTHDPPIVDYKGRVEGWVMWSDKGEEFIELLEPDAVVPGESTTAPPFTRAITAASATLGSQAATPISSKDSVPRTVPRGTSTHHLRTGKGVAADIIDGFDPNFGFSTFGDVAATADAQDGEENGKKKQSAVGSARGAHITAWDAVAKATETNNSACNQDVEQEYTTRITLKMRADADMKSDPAGEMPANSHVTVREWRALPNGTRRALVCEVKSSPEKSGWLSCVAKDGAETLRPNTVPAPVQQISPLSSQRSFTAEAPAPAPRLSQGRGDFERVRI